MDVLTDDQIAAVLTGGGRTRDDLDRLIGRLASEAADDDEATESVIAATGTGVAWWATDPAAPPPRWETFGSDPCWTGPEDVARAGYEAALVAWRLSRDT